MLYGSTVHEESVSNTRFGQHKVEFLFWSSTWRVDDVTTAGKDLSMDNQSDDLESVVADFWAVMQTVRSKMFLEDRIEFERVLKSKITLFDRKITLVTTIF